MNNELGTYLYEENIEDLFLRASNKLYRAVLHTIGPKGLNTAIPTSNDYLSIINDGKTILETISSDDMAEKLAINTLKESSFATNLQAGDGTSSSVILQHQLLNNIIAYNRSSLEESYLQLTPDIILNIRDMILENLKKYKKDLKTSEDLKNIITVALGSDRFTDIVYNAFEGLDKLQKPTLVKVNTQKDTDYIKIDGINLAPVEINPVVLKSISLAQDEPLEIIILDQEVSRIDNAFAALLQKISKSNKKTILLYTDIKPSVMDQLLFNIQEGALNLIPVRIAITSTQLPTVIEDLEKYFKLNAFNSLHPYQTEYNNAQMFGTAIGYIMNKDSIVIKNDNEEYSKEEHLVPASSSVIQVGFITYSQQAEDYRRLEDAIQSAYNAINYGYVLGAGYTYLCLAADLPESLNDEEKYMLFPIKEALNFIFSYLDPYNSMDTLKFISKVEESIFDSYKVAEQVILNSFTVVAQILSTKCLLVPYQRNRMTGKIE